MSSTNEEDTRRELQAETPPTSGPDMSDPTWGFMPRLRRLTQLYSAAWVMHVSAEVTSSQFGMLSALDAIPGQDQRSLGESLHTDKSNTADVVSRLSRRGHIRILRDERDFRRKILMLTAEGKLCLEELRPRVAELRRLTFAELADVDREAFLTGMSRLIRHLEEMTLS